MTDSPILMPRKQHSSRSYVFALAVIAVCATLMFLCLDWTYRVNQRYSQLIETSSRQQLLNQKIAYSSRELLSHQKSEQEPQYRSSLRSAINLFSRSHNFLVRGNPETQSSPVITGELSEIYFGDKSGLDDKCHRLVDLVNQLLATVPESKDQNALFEQIIQLSQYDIPKLLTAVVMNYHHIAETETKTIWMLKTASYLIILITLFAEAKLIFGPLASTISRQTSTLVQTKQQIEHAAYHDPLTDLPNRRFLAEEAEKAVQHPEIANRKFAILHIDLDDFKGVNDTLGHKAGDVVLEHVAQVLRDSVNENEFVARIGGDEFAIFAANVIDPQLLLDTATRIVDALNEPIKYNEHECLVGSSIGIAISELGETNFEKILIDSDIALYDAKRCGGRRWQLVNEQIRNEFLKRDIVAKNIRSAVDNDQLQTFFQPLVDVANDQIVGIETLIRWNTNEMSMKPAEFIGIAEDIGLMVDIDHYVVNKGLRYFAMCRDKGLSLPRISFNFSTKTIAQSEFVPKLLQVILEHGFDTSDMMIEIKESVLDSQNAKNLVSNIEAMKNAGFEITLDDFGAGQTSVSNLVKCWVSQIKLSREFVNGVSKDSVIHTISRSLIRLVNDLNIRPMAVGVENKEDSQLLAELGCRIQQGYLFAPPMSPENLEEWLEARQRNQTKAKNQIGDLSDSNSF